MCRLFGFAAAAPTTLRSLIGEEQLIRFESLSYLHGDGWGTSWVEPPTADGTSALAVQRDASAAAADPRFALQTRDLASTARIVHLRWATEGFAVTHGNSHPFHVDGISFAHNGTITPGDRLDGLLHAPAREALADTTDSERYFAVIRQELGNDPGDLGGAVLRATALLRGHYPDSSLNALLLTTSELIVVHANALSVNPVDDLTAHPADPPADHLTAYFDMRWRRTADGSLLFTSTGLDAAGWQPLPAESVTTVDLATLRMTTTAMRSAELSR